MEAEVTAGEPTGSEADELDVERRLRRQELLLARREAERDDLIAKLAALAALADRERDLRRRAEQDLEAAKSGLWYRFRLALYRARVGIADRLRPGRGSRAPSGRSVR